jgi:hypothetical protein
MKYQNINIPNNFGDTNYSTHRFRVLKGSEAVDRRQLKLPYQSATKVALSVGN